MKQIEPKFMCELHIVREEMSRQWRKLSHDKLAKELNAHKLHGRIKQKAF